MTDIFAPVGEVEQRIVRELDERIVHLQQRIRFAQTVASLEGVSAWSTFVGVLDDLGARAESQMRDHTGTDSELRVLQGRAQTYRWIIDLCRKHRQLAETLAAELTKLQDRKAKAVLPGGKVAPRSL